jgi:hypothetical protein
LAARWNAHHPLLTELKSDGNVRGFTWLLFVVMNHFAFSNSKKHLIPIAVPPLNCTDPQSEGNFSEKKKKMRKSKKEN